MTAIRTAALIVVLLLGTGCAQAPRANTAVFDLFHREAFQPIDINTLGFSNLYEMFKDGGFETYTYSEPMTSKSLSDIGVLVIAGPLQPLTPDEDRAVKGFVESGGGLLVLLHISHPVASLLKEFGILSTSGPIVDSGNIIGGNTRDFYVRDIEKGHPVTAGVDSVAVYGSWGLGTAHDDVRLLARTTPGAWIDFNGDSRYQEGEFIDVYGVVAVREYGRGKVVVVADDAPFTDQFIDQGDNRRLAGNIISWLKE